MTRSLTLHSPFLFRFKAWIDERFPLVNGLLFLIMYLSAFFYAAFLTTQQPFIIGFHNFLGFCAAWCFFLLLRVFDEHKDYELDCKNHPTRILQSGLIELRHLKITGALSILVQAGVSFTLDGFQIGPISCSWLVVFAYSLLMAKEFFISEWLSKRLVLYAFSHMLIMPLALFWLAQMGAGNHSLGGELAPLCLLAFLSGAAVEITRKTKGIEEEQEDVDSYTKVWGTTTSPRIVMVILLFALFSQMFLLSQIFPAHTGGIFYIIATMSTIYPLYTLLVFSSNPCQKARKHNEVSVALCTLISYSCLIAALISERGIQWQI